MTYLICIAGYLALLAMIAIRMSRQVKNQSDFAVAGRSLSPFVMVCTMLAVWIGTGSIVGNAEQTYEKGASALLLPIGTLFGMILLSFIASRARNIKASTVPEIIEMRFGPVARNLSMFALVVAYMVIVSYQFNAGGAVLEVITGDKDPIAVQVGDTLTQRQLTKGRLVYKPEEAWTGQTELIVTPVSDKVTEPIQYTIGVVKSDAMIESKGKQKAINEDPNQPSGTIAKQDSYVRLRLEASKMGEFAKFAITKLPTQGASNLVEPKLTAHTATMIAAACIIGYTALAGLMSLAYMDIVTGIIITIAMVVGLPLYWIKAGGYSGMEQAFLAMGDKPDHMKWNAYSAVDLINFILPVFLLVLGDANQYQRIFASRNAKGAKSAVTAMIFVAFAIEILIIACAWAASSLAPDPEDGKYILIHAAKNIMSTAPGIGIVMSHLFMVTVVAIIMSTANSFLHVPSTTVINDVYLKYINPKATDKRVLLLSRILVVVFGIIGWLVSMAFAESTGFFRKALFAFTIYGAAVTPALVAAIVWKGATKAGAISSILVGTVVSIGWQVYLKNYLPDAISSLDAVLPALILSVGALVVVSLLTQKTGGSGLAQE
ncbi:MAG: sodium:solute symporter family protein [Phycisphaeraceae bacterium]|nr:sodium:solute symporter family protein [Phycisphaeraceae bacterium]